MKIRKNDDFIKELRELRSELRKTKRANITSVMLRAKLRARANKLLLKLGSEVFEEITGMSW